MAKMRETAVIVLFTESLICIISTDALIGSKFYDYVVLDRHTHNTFTGTTILL
jgi:hypothetical protein